MLAKNSLMPCDAYMDIVQTIAGTDNGKLFRQRGPMMPGLKIPNQIALQLFIASYS